MSDRTRGHREERFDHDGTWRHHHDADTGRAVWWTSVDQFGGDKIEHWHEATLDAERAAPSPYADAAEHARQERAGTHLYDDNCAFCWFAEHGPDAERAAQGGLREAALFAIGQLEFIIEAVETGGDIPTEATIAQNRLRAALAAQPTPALDAERLARALDLHKCAIESTRRGPCDERCADAILARLSNVTAPEPNPDA